MIITRFDRRQAARKRNDHERCRSQAVQHKPRERVDRERVDRERVDRERPGASRSHLDVRRRCVHRVRSGRRTLLPAGDSRPGWVRRRPAVCQNDRGHVVQLPVRSMWRTRSDLLRAQSLRERLLHPRAGDRSGRLRGGRAGLPRRRRLRHRCVRSVRARRTAVLRIDLYRGGIHLSAGGRARGDVRRLWRPRSAMLPRPAGRALVRLAGAGVFDGRLRGEVNG